jgi:Subtilase family
VIFIIYSGVMNRPSTFVPRRKVNQLWRVLPLGAASLISCNQIPTTSVTSEAVAGTPYTVTVQIGSSDTSLKLEQKYGGSVLSWHPEAGFAILGVTARPPSNDPSIKGIDENAGTLKAPVVATTNRVPLTPQGNAANAENVWMGGWTSWAGGWTSWAGGWTSWAGGSSIPSLPAQNNVAFSQIRLPQAQAISRNFGAGVKVAVIDTGIDLAHPIFAGRLAPAAEWKDFVDNDATPQEVGTSADRGFGHGTGVAGIILQVAPKATILPLRVLDKNGSGDLDKVVLAIDWAIAKGAQVINLSLGSAQNQTSLTTELQYAASKKVYVVASAGNDGALNGLTYPAASTHTGSQEGFVFGIGSVNSNDILSSFTNYGWDLFGIAPGESIFSAYPGNMAAAFTGTSFAAPIFSGALALGLKELPTGADSTAFYKYMVGSFRSGNIYDDNLRVRGSEAIGSGRLDIEAMIRNFSGWTPKVSYSATNFAKNGLFSGYSLSGWSTAGTPGVMLDNGNVAVKLKPNEYISQTVTGLKPNTNYTLMAMMRTSTAAESLSLSVDNFGGASSMTITPNGMSYAPRYLTFTTGPNTTSADITAENWLGNTQPQYVYNISLRQSGY